MNFADNTNHQQLHQVVSQQIRAAILNGRIKPGEWIRQQSIAEELGVSQMPVREALKELAAEGLVEHIPYRGARVVHFSKEDIQDIYAHRGYLESLAAKFAAATITDAEIETLSNIQLQIESHTHPTKILKYRELNRAFHQSIYRLSQRNYIIRALDQIWATFPTMLISKFAVTANTPILDRRDIDIQEHHIILAALQNRDAAATQKAIEKHINSVYQDLVLTLENYFRA